jgi:hypothetical protein
MLGLLPYCKVPYDSLATPFLTRDYLKMRVFTESKTQTEKLFNMLYVTQILFVNCTGNAILKHMNKRGVLTCYWVLNDPDEIKFAIKNTNVAGIMTDRPAAAKELI